MVWFDSNTLTWQFAFNAIVVWMVNKAKKSEMPMFSWISTETTHINKWVGVVTSLLVTLGIHYKFNYDPTVANGTLVLTLTGVSFTTLMASAKDWVVSYGFQHMGHQVGMIKEVYDEFCKLRDENAKLRTQLAIPPAISGGQ